jgi:hypothetical protein
VLAALCVVGAALVGTLLYALFVYDPKPADIAWQVTRVEVGDEETIRVTIVVDKPPGSEARCQIAAFTSKRRSAGRLDGIVIGARDDGSRVNELTVVVPTEKPATSAQVSQCVLVDPRG